MKEWYTASDLAGMPDMPGTTRAIQLRSKREKWNSRKRQARGGGCEYHISSLPLKTQAHLLLQASESTPKPTVKHHHKHQPLSEHQRASLWSVFARKPEKMKARGKHAVSAMQLYFQLCNQADIARDAGQRFDSRSQIECMVADAFDVSVPTVRNWKSAVKNIHPSDWWPVLTPKYAGRTETSEISPEAWDYFKADYLRLESPTAAACYDRMVRAGRDRGWKIPHLRTVERKLKRELSTSIITLARRGQEAVQRMYPYQERDRSVFHALEAVNADGHKFDVFVRWPDGEIGRPLMCAWQDIYSGKMLSYRVDKTENSDAIRLSFGDMVETYGKPSDAYLDNGRGFASKWMTGGTPTRYRFKVKDEEPSGIMTTLGVKIHWATPYHGQAKPIERAFRDFCEYVAKHPAFAGAYTGNNPTAKPENYGSKAIDLDVFMKVLEAEIAAHNARTGRTGGLTNGRSFDQVFAESYSKAVICKATEEQRRLWLLAAESVSVRKQDGTIHMRFDKRNRYWDEALEEHAGQKVVVRFDPEYLHDPVHVYTLDNRFICTAICLEAEGFNNTEAAREHAKNRKRFVRAAKDQLLAERRMTALEAAAMLPELKDGDTPDAKVVRMIRPERDVPVPSITPLTEVEQAEYERLQAEQAAEDTSITSNVIEFGDDPIRNYQLWEALKARDTRGEQLTDQERRLMDGYATTHEWSAMKKFNESE